MGDVRWLRHLGAALKRLQNAFAAMFDPAVSVGDKSRARGQDEADPDEAILTEKSRQWDEMYRNYPPVEERPEGKKDLSWRDKLMTHVRPLLLLNGTLFALFLVGGSLYPPTHPLPTIAIILSSATLGYWFWIGRWRKWIVDRVFDKFREKYGKHWHLK